MQEKKGDEQEQKQSRRSGEGDGLLQECVREIYFRSSGQSKAGHPIGWRETPKCGDSQAATSHFALRLTYYLRASQPESIPLSFSPTLPHHTHTETTEDIHQSMDAF